MVRILFVCHGNICRSPMAEFVMKDLVKKNGLESRFEIASAATSAEELCNPVHPGTRRKLNENGIRCDGKYAQQMTRRDYDEYDLLICMDENNLRNMRRMLGGDPEGKISKLMAFAGSIADVSDPWYTDRFDVCYRDILAGCQGLLDTLLSDV